MSSKILNKLRDEKKQLFINLKKDWDNLQIKNKDICSVFPDFVAPWVIDGSICDNNGRVSVIQRIVAFLPTDPDQRMSYADIEKKLNHSYSKTYVYNVVSEAIKNEEVIDGFRIEMYKADGERHQRFYKVKAQQKTEKDINDFIKLKHNRKQ